MRALLVAALLVLALLATLRLFRDQVARLFLFHPEPLRPLESAPHLWGWPQAEEVWIETEDGVRLHAWWFPGPREGASSGVAVLFHGNAGHLGPRGEVAARIEALGFSVLLPDYRGYGLSEGTPDEEGFALDAEAVVRRALSLSDVPAERLLLVGNSMGSAVAARYAARHRVGLLVLVAAFTEAAAVGRHAYPWLPGWMFEWNGNRFETARHVARVDAPVLVAAAGEDRLIPRDVARGVYEAAPEPKRWLVLDGAAHGSALHAGGLWREVEAMAREHLRAARGPGDAQAGY